MQKTNHLTPFIWLLIIGAGFTRGTFFMAFPFLAIHLSNILGASPTEIGFVLGSGPLVGTFTGFYGAYLSDKFGRRAILIMSLLLWGVTMIGFGFADSIFVFGILSVMNSFFRSVSEPVIQAIISERLEPAARTAAFHYRYYAINVGAVIGPALGSFLFAENSSYGFFVAGIALFIFCTVYATSQSSHELLQDVETVKPSFLEAVKIMGSDRSLLCYVLASILCATAYVQTESTLPLIMNDIFGAKGVVYFSWVLISNGVTIVCAQLLLNRLTKKIKIEWNVAVSCIVFGLGFLGFGYSGNSVSYYVISMVILALGEALVFSNGYVLIDRLAPSNLKATYHSTGNFFSLGFAIGPFLGALILSQYGQTELFTFCFAVLCVCSLLYLLPLKIRKN